MNDRRSDVLAKISAAKLRLFEAQTLADKLGDFELRAQLAEAREALEAADRRLERLDGR